MLLTSVCGRHSVWKHCTHPSLSPRQWVCQFCTYLNYSPATVCEMCDLARPEPAALPVKLRPPYPVRRVPALAIKPSEPAPQDLDCWRQTLMREEGSKLIHLIRASQCEHQFHGCRQHPGSYSRVCLLSVHPRKERKRESLQKRCTPASRCPGTPAFCRASG